MTVAILVACIVLTPIAPAYAAFGDGSPTITNPSVFTAQDSKAKVDGATGAFTQRIAIDIPPGRNGMQPDLALDYNSQNTEDSMVGYGWSLSIPYIQRINKTGTEDLYGTSTPFTSSIDGELATTSTSTPNTYRPRVDEGSFRSYSFGGNSWTVYDKNGTRYRFGFASTSQQYATTSTSNVFKWMLDEIRDTNNNYVKFTYLKDGNEIYPYQIIYTGSGSTDGPSTISFSTSTRSDVLVSYKSGFKVWTNHRISQITAKFNSTMVRQYALSYTTGHNGYRSLLSRIEETGRDDDGNQLTLPPMTFTYAASTTAFYAPSDASMQVNGQSYVVSDTNGDAINDVNKFYFNQSTSATGSSMLIDQATVVNTVVPPDWWSYTPDPPTPQERGVRYLDVTGDGKADLLRGIWDNIAGTTTQKLYVNTSTTSSTYGWTLATTTLEVAYADLTNPSAYWKFDESLTGDNPIDSTPNGNTLTNNNNATYNTGKINNSAVLASSSLQAFSIANGTWSELNPSTAFSLSFWLKLTSLPGANEYSVITKGNATTQDFRVLLGPSNGGNNSIYVIYCDNGCAGSDEAHFGEFDGPANYFSAGDVGSWVHIAVVVDATNKAVTAYKNGTATSLTKRAASGATAISMSSVPFDVGRKVDIRYLNGAIDEMGFWKNGKLTVGQINSLYNAGAGNSYPFSTTSPAVQSGIVPSFQWYGTGTTTKVTTGLLGDVNGDSFADFVLSLDGPLNGIPSNSTYLGNGSAWDSGTTTTFVAAKQLPTATSTMTNSMLIDITGDRLADWVYSDATTSKTYVLVNNGRGWESSADVRWTLPTTTLYRATSTANIFDRGIRFFDINGDGLLDYVRAYSYGSGGCSPEGGPSVSEVKLNTGSGWATSTAYSLPAYITTASGGVCSFNEYGNWRGNGQMAQDVIGAVTYPKGGTTSITYGNTAQVGGNPRLPYALLVVTSLVNNDGQGGSNETTTYSYKGGLQYLPSNEFDRKFGGFASTTETRPDRITTTYYNQSDLVDTTIGERSDGYAQINHPFRIDVFSALNALVKKTFNRWDTYDHGNSTFVGLGRQIVQTYAPDGTFRTSATDYQYSSTTNDLLEVDQYGEVTGNSDGTFSDIAGDTRTTYVTYAASSSVNMSLPVRKRATDNAAATSTDTKLYYDSKSYGSITKGNNTKQEDWISGSTYASSTKSYTSLGLVGTSTDRNGRTATSTFDSFNLYPATTSNALYQLNTYTYNYSNGKVKQAIDANSRITKNTYDGVGRLTLVEQSSTTTPSTVETRTSFSFADSSTTASYVRQREFLNAATTTDLYTYFDGLGRTKQERRSSENNATTSAVDYVYNTAGLLSSKSLPYFSAGASSTALSSNTALFTSYVYDPLGRIGTTTNAVGTTTNYYSKWTTTVTDALGHVKDYTSDAFNNLVQVREYFGDHVATTTYTYDAANNLSTTTDAYANVRKFTYDGLGRRLSAQDLHATSDATFGSWSYTYDHAGNLTSQTDPKSQIVNRTYDALNRLLTEDYTGASGTEVTLTYDTCTKGKGYLCTASSTAVLLSSAYDVLGRVSIATSSILYASTSVMTYGYDRQGNITNITYPNGSRLSYLYNGAGLLESASRANSGGSFASVVSNFDYAPTNLLSFKKFGSGASTSLSYDANALYRLSRMATYGATTSSGVGVAPNGYWQLDESSGTAADSSGNGNTLSNDNNTAFTTGKINNGADFESANDNYLSITNGSQVGLDPSSTFSCAGWVKFETLPGAGEAVLCGKYDSSGSSSSFAVELGAEPNGIYVIYTSSGIATGTNYEEFDSPSGLFTSTGTWYHVAVAVDATNRTATAWVNGSAVTMTRRAGQNATSIYQGSAKFTLGAIESGASVTREIDGIADEVAFWKGYLLTQNDANALYNSGSGAEIHGAYTLLQDLSYTYDRVGNISALSDLSDTDARKTTAFSYDELNRLLTASTTSATSSPYSYVYSYNDIGNITTGGGGQYSTTTVTTPQSYWKFDESTTGATSSDSAGSNNLSNTNNVTFGTGKRNNAASLVAASSQSFTIANGTWTDLDPTSAFSMSFWIKLSSLATGSTEYSIVSKSDGSTSDFRIATYEATAGYNELYVLWTDAGSFGAGQSHLGEYDSIATFFDSGDVGQWVHVAIVADVTNQSVTVYKNGTASSMTKRASCNASTISQSAVRFDVGRMGLAKYLNGGLDEMRFWKNYKLTAAEVTSLYNLSIGGKSYTYAGTGYANPHAVTLIEDSTSSTTLTYDANGNLVQTVLGATTTTYVYDYANRLTAVGISGATSTYAYDWLGNRVRQVSGGATTTYPFKYYSLIKKGSVSTSTEYVFGGDTLVATVDGTGSATTTRYIHPDHLGSTNVVSDSNMHAVQVLDYYPYGGVRVSTSSSNANTKRKYIGQFLDEGTNLDYLNARYYDASRGQFLSEDATFLAVGYDDKLKQIGTTQSEILTDPQRQNSYNYARGNPVGLSDPSGNWTVLIRAALLVMGSAVAGVQGGDALNTNFGPNAHVFSPQQQNRDAFAAAFEFAVMGVSAVSGPVKMARSGEALDNLSASLTVGDAAGSDYIYRQYNKNHPSSAGMFNPASYNRFVPTPIDIARAKSGTHTPAPRSSTKPTSAQSRVDYSGGSSQSAYSAAVAALTQIRDALARYIQSRTGN